MINLKNTNNDNNLRIAIVNENKCKPKKCDLECKKSCPSVKIGNLCIEVTSKDSKAFISEELCIGCNICTKTCPFSAIDIINLPKELTNQTIHRYGPNSFKLHRLPTPKTGNILGLVGSNGTGKSTALKILAGKLMPNLGDYNNILNEDDILKYFRGSELQNYFKKYIVKN